MGTRTEQPGGQHLERPKKKRHSTRQPKKFELSDTRTVSILNPLLHKPQMNIFVLHSKPRKAARYHADKHVVKMLLESVQMLYTAHWIVVFPCLLKHRAPIQISQAQKKLPTPPNLQTTPFPAYRPVHIHHPCSVWVRQSRANYMWLASLALALADEHEFRWPASPTHTCRYHAEWLLTHPPSLPDLPLTPFALAMPEDVKKHDAIQSYRAFYKGSKTDRGITDRYTRRHRPHWL